MNKEDNKQKLISAIYNTKLPLIDEMKYRFDKFNSPAFRNDKGYDYDLRGYWQEKRSFPKNGHLPDTHKNPTHITYSTDSKYNSPTQQGGQWQDLGNGNWSFTPSEYNLQMYSPQEYIDYFQRFEPGNQVILPKEQM